MLSKHSQDQLPGDHLVRKIEEAVDFSFIYEKATPLYSSKGRPSIAPFVFIKLLRI